MADIDKLGYGIIRGRFLAGILDTVDVGIAPDGIPLTGYVSLTATATALKVAGATPSPVTVFPNIDRIDLDTEGYLSHNGSRDIALWATDDPDANPVGWMWKVSFFLKYNGKDIQYPSFFFSLPEGEVRDLTVVAPLTQPSPGAYIIKGDKGEPGGDMTESDFITLLEEQKGEPSGIASLGEDQKLQASQIPVYLSESELTSSIDEAVAAGVPAEVASALADQPEVLAAAVALAQSDANLVKKSDPIVWALRNLPGWALAFLGPGMRAVAGITPSNHFKAAKGFMAPGGEIITSGKYAGYSFAVKGANGRFGELAMDEAGNVHLSSLLRWGRRMGVLADTTAPLRVRKSPGAGEYATIPDAIAALSTLPAPSATRWYTIEVHEGVWTEANWTLPDYVHLMGVGQRDLIRIEASQPDSVSDAQLSAFQAFTIRGTCMVSGLTVSVLNGRYVIHDESNGVVCDWDHRLTNVTMEHRGNDGVILYRAANGLPAGNPVGGNQAYGFGASSGSVLRWRNVRTINRQLVFPVHDREDWDKPGDWLIEDSELFAKSADARIEVQCLGSGVTSSLTLRATTTNAIRVAHTDVPWISTTNLPADHYNIRVTIDGQQPIGFETSARGKALRITSASTGAVSTVTVTGGTAGPVLWGVPTSRAGGSGMQGYVYGSLDMSGILVGINQDTTVANTLGRRLGNRAATPVAFTVSVDGGAAQTVTLAADYTSMSDADILTAINAQLTGATADLYLVVQGEHYPSYPDRTVWGMNRESVAIPRFAAVKLDTDGYGVRLMGTSDPASVFAGVTVTALPPGGMGRVLRSSTMQTASQMFGLSTIVAASTPIYLSDSTPGAFSLTGTRQVARTVIAGWAQYKGASS